MGGWEGAFQVGAPVAGKAPIGALEFHDGGALGALLVHEPQINHMPELPPRTPLFDPAASGEGRGRENVHSHPVTFGGYTKNANQRL